MNVSSSAYNPYGVSSLSLSRMQQQATQAPAPSFVPSAPIRAVGPSDGGLPFGLTPLTAGMAALAVALGGYALYKAFA